MKINDELLAESIHNHFNNGDLINLAIEVLGRISWDEINFDDFDLSIEDEINDAICWTVDQWALIEYYFDVNDGATWNDAVREFAAELTQVVQDAMIETEEFEEIEDE